MAKTGQKGFTLVEVMVAVVIIAIGVLAMGSLLISSITNNRGSEYRMDAATVSQALLSQYAAYEAAGTSWSSPATGTREGFTFTVTKTSMSSTEVLLTVQLTNDAMPATYENQLIVSTASGG